MNSSSKILGVVPCVLLLSALILPQAIGSAAEQEQVLFEERFSDKIDDGWTWLHDEPKLRQLEAGKLVLTPLSGSWWRTLNNSKNDLVRDLPSADSHDIAAEVYIENRPVNQFEHAGIVWYYDEDNYIALNKEFISKPIVLFVIEKAAAPAPPFGEFPYEAEGIWLRLRIHKQTVTGQYRATDRDDWKLAGSREFPGSTTPHIGLHAGLASGKGDRKPTASFSHFRILKISE